MADSNIPKDIADSLKSIFTNINTERISEILVAVVLCFIGFVLARIISNTFIRTIGSRFNAHQRLVWRRGIFISFSYFHHDKFERSWVQT